MAASIRSASMSRLASCTRMIQDRNGLHLWHEPLDRIVALGNARNIPVVTPEAGKPMGMVEATDVQRWWVELAGRPVLINTANIKHSPGS